MRNTNKSRIDRHEQPNEEEGTNNNEAVVPDQEIFEQDVYDPMDGTEEMTESEVREAALMNDYLGKQLVKNFEKSSNKKLTEIKN